MYLPLNTFSPDVKLGLVSASRNCFIRSLAENRTRALLDACGDVKPVLPQGECAIIETKDHAIEAAAQLRAAGCDAAVLYLGNFSPEIEDAVFVKEFGGPVMMPAAAEESTSVLAEDRGDALCGLLSAVMAVTKRGLASRIHIPETPVAGPEQCAAEIAHFLKVMKVVKGVRSATIGLFGPRPRDFETCNYNLASLAGLGVEIEELGFHDLANEVNRVKKEEDVSELEAALRKLYPEAPEGEFVRRLALYETALLKLRDDMKLSGITTQCWIEQEYALGHVPCSVNARLAASGVPVACENDAYSLTAELMAQYATDAAVTVLDLNHSIPADLHPDLKKYPPEELVGMFHCGNTAAHLLKEAKLKYQVIMKRLVDPDADPHITYGTIEGQIAASPITLVQLHGAGDGLRAYAAQGEFLDVDPKTFGATGTAHIPGFTRFYRHVLLGRFHHHAAVAFAHCGAVIFDALKLLGVGEFHAPLPAGALYPGENPF